MALRFSPDDLDASKWENIEPYLINLKEREINSADCIIDLIQDESQLTEIISETRARTYINMTSQTDNQEYQKAWGDFVENIQPKLSEYSDVINKKIINNAFVDNLPERYAVMLRGIKSDIKIFREENIPLQTRLSILGTKYNEIRGKQTVYFEGEEKTLPMMAIYQENTDREIRESAWRVTTSRILQDTDKVSDIFEEMIVPPSPGDSGSAIGAANFAFLEKSKTKILDFTSIFLGPKKNFVNKRESKDNFFSKINLTNEFVNETAAKLIEGEIIASYYGSNEVGPRSLGNTSIFCDAKNQDAAINLNINLKKRGHFQPLAPILLEEDFQKYFSINKSVVKNLEWMGTLCEAKEELYKNYSSIIHIDGTCRTQVVKNENSLTYKVLKNLKSKDSDILVNTSFNISKDPVVFDLYDVYVNMKRMNIKFVLMDDGLYQTKDI